MPGIRLKDIPSFIRTTDRDDVMLNFDGGEAQNARKARGVILNTYDALEQDVVDALRREFPRVYTVGPLASSRTPREVAGWTLSAGTSGRRTRAASGGWRRSARARWCTSTSAASR